MDLIPPAKDIWRVAQKRDKRKALLTHGPGMTMNPLAEDQLTANRLPEDPQLIVSPNEDNMTGMKGL